MAYNYFSKTAIQSSLHKEFYSFVFFFPELWTLRWSQVSTFFIQAGISLKWCPPQLSLHNLHKGFLNSIAQFYTLKSVMNDLVIGVYGFQNGLNI